MKTIFFVALMSLSSCGRDADEEAEIAIRRARRFLTERKCTPAHQSLQGLYNSGNYSRNQKFLSLYASSLACSGNYEDVRFFSDNLSTLAETTLTGLHYSLAKLYNASDSPDSAEYASLAKAISVLLYPGGLTSTSHTDRLKIFNAEEAVTVNTQLLYMVITQLGRYVRFYGNIGPNDDDNMEKGQRSPLANRCFTDYTTTISQAQRALLIDNSCNGDSNGHPDMKASSSRRGKVMCEGIVLMNNFFELLTSIAFSGDNTEELRHLQTLNSQLCKVILPESVICNTKTQSVCEQASAKEQETFMIVYFENITPDI